MAPRDDGPRQLRERIRVEPEPTKGSRFIATAVPVPDEAAAKQALAELRARMPDATHHCSAWRLASPNLERANDDGEPGGSAGRPILAQLQGRNLVNAAVIVTRYYGGTKLGVGGLVRAYGGAAAAALDEAHTEPYVPTVALRIQHGYPDTDVVDRLLSEAHVTQREVDYGTDICRDVEVAVDQLDALADALRDATRGRARVQRVD
ncbi:MAG: IMPACT family protein [Nannocystaceae bacterium]|nr:YigZ family protein [bacterium]